MDRWIRHDDGVARCWWPGEDDDYRRYHDDEWGRPTTDDRALFEKLCLEGFQSGLSWLTILRKRENFRAAFAGFDPAHVAHFDERDVERLLADAGIIRHEGKIRSTINNARRALELVDEAGSLAAHLWTFEPTGDEPTDPDGDAPLPSATATSTCLAKDLKGRGWTFIGPTTAYAFMQAMGLVNDHLDGCDWRAVCARARASAEIPTGPTDQRR